MELDRGDEKNMQGEGRKDNYREAQCPCDKVRMPWNDKVNHLKVLYVYKVKKRVVS